MPLYYAVKAADAANVLLRFVAGIDKPRRQNRLIDFLEAADAGLNRPTAPLVQRWASRDAQPEPIVLAWTRTGRWLIVGRDGRPGAGLVAFLAERYEPIRLCRGQIRVLWHPAAANSLRIT